MTYNESVQTLINAGSSSTGTIEYKLGSSGTYSEELPSAMNVGTYTVYYKVVGDSNHNNVAENSIEVTIEKAESGISIISNSGTIEYTETKTITVDNPHNLELTCESSNTSAVTCSVDINNLNNITITGGSTAATGVTITIQSTETTNYNSGQLSYVVTSKLKTMSVTANGYTGSYDGSSHGITVTANEGATIKYGTVEGIYDLEASPKYTNVDTYPVYYEVTKEGYETVRGSKTVVIRKAEGSVVAPTAKTLTYNESAQTLINAGSTSTGTIQYKLGESGTYSTELPSATNAGTYTVYYKVIGNDSYEDVEEDSIGVTISEGIIQATATGYTGEVDGAAHGITVTVSSPSDATIKYRTSASGEYNLTSSPTRSAYGTTTVYYEITKIGYETVTGSATVRLTTP